MANIQYSPEQAAFFEIAERHGIFFNQANAGSGKTECSSELFRRIYVAEEERMYPHIRKKRENGITMHVSGDDQMRILDQFIVITFTVKAADELNTRIRSKMIASGIPEPKDKYGNPVKICRTIDSLLQKWFRNPIFFKAWTDWEFEQSKIDKESGTKTPRISTAHHFLSKELEGVLGEDFPNSKWAFFQSWPTLLVGPMLDAVVASLMRAQFRMELPDILDPFKWRDDIRNSLRECRMNGRKIEVPFHKKIMDASTKQTDHQNKVREHLQRVAAGRGNAEDLRYAGKYEKQVELWDRVELAVGEFMMVYGIAKTRSYHPYLAPDNINNDEVLEALAQNQIVNSVMLLHSLSKKYSIAKYSLGMMDYSDYMDQFLYTARARSGILDVANEYPKYKIRAKNLIIDETQDNAPSQYEIMRIMKPARAVPFRSVAVGDAKQSIYAFRGASPKHFIRAVEIYKQNHRDRVFSLSCSFRSCKRIVALGNEIVKTLPSYKDTVVESSTIYDEPGRIVVSPSLKDQKAESDYILQEIDKITREDKGASIMVLVRQSIYSHPLYRILSKMENPPAEMLTMHRSKGLEADYVFVTGMTSGEFPDVRGDWDQEVNLFYVATTRARRCVYYTVPIYRTVINLRGEPEIRDAGPSPYLHIVPTLHKIANDAGWEESALMEGFLYHTKEVETFQSSLASRFTELKSVADKNFPSPTYTELEDINLEQHPELPTSDTLAFLRRKRPAPPKGSLQADGTIGVAKNKTAVTWTEDGDQKLLKKLRKSYSTKMRVPDLKGDELARCITKKWVEHNGKGSTVFSESFKSLLRAG